MYFCLLTWLTWARRCTLVFWRGWFGLGAVLLSPDVAGSSSEMYSCLLMWLVWAKRCILSSWRGWPSAMYSVFWRGWLGLGDVLLSPDVAGLGSTMYSVSWRGWPGLGDVLLSPDVVGPGSTMLSCFLTWLVWARRYTLFSDAASLGSAMYSILSSDVVGLGSMVYCVFWRGWPGLSYVF